MDLLEHPLEAVAFRLYSLPIPEAAATGAAAAWTCLAAVLAAAAAAGLWRLRASAPSSAAVAVSAKKPLELDPSSRAAAEVSSPPEPSRPSSRRSPPEPAAASSPKERYTAYFRDAGCVGCCDVGRDEDGDLNEEEDDDVAEGHEDGGDRDVFVSGEAADPFGWEVVRSLSPTARRYRGSPTATALSGGSVVQLWDQSAGARLTPTAASPRLRGRVVVGGAVSVAF